MAVRIQVQIKLRLNLDPNPGAKKLRNTPVQVFKKFTNKSFANYGSLKKKTFYTVLSILFYSSSSVLSLVTGFSVKSTGSATSMLFRIHEASHNADPSGL